MTPEHTALVARLGIAERAEDEPNFVSTVCGDAAAAITALAGELQNCKARYQDLGAIAGPMTAERDTLRAEVERLSKLDCQASAHVESVVCMRTHFTGEPPYVGWLGIGLAINEVIDERDTLRAEVAALKLQLEMEQRSGEVRDVIIQSLRDQRDATLADKQEKP